MRVLYIATDVTFPAMNGGSRRAYETAKIFQKFGHTSVVLVDKLDHEKSFEIYEGIRVYRSKLFDVGSHLRNLTTKVKTLFKKGSTPVIPYYSSKTSQYDTYYPNLMKFDLKWKISDFYRHKFPLHKWIKIFPAIYRLFHIIKEEHIDLIIERGPSYGVGAIISKIFNRPYIVDFIDVMYSNLALRCADSVLTYFTKIQIPQFVSKNRVQLVYTCADTEKFKPREKNYHLLKKYGIKEEFIVIYVGGMYPWHGLEIIVEAADMIIKDGYQDIKFLLVGDGVVRRQIEELVAQKKLQNYVIFAGKVNFDEVPSYLNSSDVALSLNTGDSIGFKLIEYMASGIPIIATDADNLRYAGRENIEMLYVNLNDSLDLKEKILRLRNDPEFAQKISKNARKKTEQFFEWNTHYKNIVNALKIGIKQKKTKGNNK